MGSSEAKAADDSRRQALLDFSERAKERIKDLELKVQDLTVQKEKEREMTGKMKLEMESVQSAKLAEKDSALQQKSCLRNRSGSSVSGPDLFLRLFFGVEKLQKQDAEKMSAMEAQIEDLKHAHEQAERQRETLIQALRREHELNEEREKERLQEKALQEKLKKEEARLGAKLDLFYSCFVIFS